jgi:integrin alpha 7
MRFYLLSSRYAVRDVAKDTHKVIDSKRAMIGLCYILNPDLSLPRNDQIGYKNLMVVRDAVGGKKLEPRRDIAFEDHAQWGACQAGIAASFVEDDDEDLALFGAPGCFTWRGNLFGQKVGTIRRYDVAVDHHTKQSYSKYGHMGLSVASGRFFGGRMYHVSGAPSAGTLKDGSRTGEVYFLQRVPSENRFKPEKANTLRGESFGSGFGYSLAVMDANGDSTPDLLVGAPFFDGGKTGKGGAVYLYLSKKRNLDPHRPVKIIGQQLESQFGLALTNLGDLNHDGFEDFAVGAPYESDSGGSLGAVYIFFGGQNGLRSLGPNDEFHSAAVAADQVIRASALSQYISEVPNSLTTFGSSLSGGKDMDGNGYPDLVVGAYQSNRIFVFRGRPIIDIETFVNETNLKAIDPSRNGCPEDPQSEEACFAFKACFSVDKEVSEQGLEVKFMIEAEPKKPVSRVWLRLMDEDGYIVDDGRAEKSNNVTNTIKIRNGRSRRQHCTGVIGYVSSLTDLQTPVQFAMSYSLVQGVPEMVYLRGYPMPDVDEYPILNQAQAKKRFQATFEKDCGGDEICQSQLSIMPTLKNKHNTELGRTPGGYYELELGTLVGNELVLDLEIDNLGESAYEATLDIYFPPAVSYIGLGAGTVLNAPDLNNATWLSFSLGNPFKGADTPTTVQLRFSPRSDMNEKIIQFDIIANTTSEQIYDPSTFVRMAIVRRAEVKVVGGGYPREVHFGGRIRGESALSDLPEIGPQIVHKFLVINGGPSEVDVLTVHIGWPIQVENGKEQGKWLLYLTEHPLLKNGRGDCTLPIGYSANPLNLTGGVHDGISARHALFPPEDDAESNLVFDNLDSLEAALYVSKKEDKKRRRKKREVEKVVLPHKAPSNDGHGEGVNVVTFDCDRGTAKCMSITCQIYNLPAKVPATIEIKSRLWNSTLVEDYLDNIARVEIYSKAKVTVDKDVTQDISDDYVSVLTTAYPDSRKLHAEVGPAWWVVLVSVLVGLLVLVVISLVLWRLGFFKRRRRPGAVSGEDDDSDFMMSAHFEKVRLNGNST